MARDVNIDALLGEGALVFTLGGQKYEVADVTVGTLLEAQNASDARDPRELLGRLIPGLEGDKLQNIGAKAAAIMLQEITAFFAQAAPEAAAATVIPVDPTGPEQSPAS